MVRKRIRLLIAMMILALTLNACGKSEVEKEKTKIREVAQKYFDALKVGDQEGEYDCYLPTERQKRDAESGLLGFASRLILNVDVSDVLSDWNILFGEESTFAKYKYKATDVVLDEDGADAVAYIDVYEEKEFRESVRINMMKYGGNWYVLYGTIADDDREPYEMVDRTTPKQSSRIWMFTLIVAVLVATAVFLVQFLQTQRGRRRAAAEIPFDGSLGGKMEPGDILCSCGTINPTGVRTCMGCGKKLKKRR